MAPPNGDDCGSPGPSGELSSGSVVFSLPHVRGAIFAYHAQVIRQRREEALRDVPRAIAGSLWTSLSKGTYYLNAHYHFKEKLDIVERKTSLLSMLSRLGLQPASWLDVVLNQHNDASAWLITYSHHRKSHVIDLGTHPQCRQSSGNAFEHPNLDPMEMLLYGVTGEFYSRSRMLQRADSTPLWTGFFRDEQARVYFVSLANTKHHSFLLDAAQKCPKVLYSPDSPLLPIYDSFSFSPEHDAAIYVSKPPPWPLIQGFVVGQDRHATELRRILERARDLFAHLATLQDYGISLDAQEFGIDWPSSFMYPDRGPWLIPAYLSRAGQADGEGRLLRTGHWEEALPQPHVRPWPVNILKGRSGSSTVPWSQAAAYADARVEGPKTYFYGINSASWNETAAAERRASWSTYNKLYVDMSKARHRHHGDLLAASKDIFSHIFCTRYVAVDKCIKVLTSKSLSTAYECWLAAETATLPPASSSSGRSGLFRACLACPIDADGSSSDDSALASTALLSGSCNSCTRWSDAIAIPAALEQLLLRIVRSDVDATTDIVTAREASEIMNDIMETETPRFQALYERWVDAQEEAPRLTTPLELRLPSILGDDSVHRWLMLELLRGNYLSEEFRRPELNEMRDHIKNNLSPAQMKLRDRFRVACGDVVAAGDAGEEAGHQVKKAVAAEGLKGAAKPAASSSNAAGEADEAGSRSSGAKRGGKRGGGDSTKPASDKKKSKKTK